MFQRISKSQHSYPVTVYTDSDHLTNAVKDKRLRIVIAMLREVLEPEPWVKILRIPTNRMFADGLTKIDSPLVFLVEGFMHAVPATFPAAARKRDVVNNAQICHRMHEG